MKFISWCAARIMLTSVSSACSVWLGYVLSSKVVLTEFAYKCDFAQQEPGENHTFRLDGEPRFKESTIYAGLDDMVYWMDATDADRERRRQRYDMYLGGQYSLDSHWRRDSRTTLMDVSNKVLRKFSPLGWRH
ncbi:hypothetical protein FOZ61_011048 [Perkinsus olseni]|uniref:Uncharacterized protein n=1 Tax=Perkinsus olseni TaxID=32597 RepID=A0A7J6KXG2_PEROL|nr:hypothetical protein FOZ61_011048 [Perkinsus olseni]KAF4651938.1 hypothetical protein FOL46_009981 [Perkinsus olseni]